MESNAEWNTTRFTDTHTNAIEGMDVQRQYPKPEMGDFSILPPLPPNPNVFPVSSNDAPDPDEPGTYFRTDDYNDDDVPFADGGEDLFGEKTIPHKALPKNTAVNPVLTDVLNTLENDAKADMNDLKKRFADLVTGVNYEKFDLPQFRILIKKILTFFPELIDTIIQSIALAFVDLYYLAETGISAVDVKKLDKNADISSLKKQIYCMLAIPFAYVVAYNWWFIFTTDVPYMKIGQTLQANKVSDFFLDCPMTPLVMLNYILIGFKYSKKGQSLTSLLVKLRPFLCLIIFGFIVMTYFAVFYTTSYFKKTMTDAIDSKENKLYSLVFSIVIIAFVFNKIFFMNKAIIPGVLAAFKAIASPITFIVMRIIQFLFILVFVPFSMLAVLFYLMAHSFFGIFMYGGSWSQTIRSIQYDVENTVPKVENENCFNDPWYMKLLRWVNKYLYAYRLYIIFAIAFIMNIASTFQDFKSESLKMAIFGFYLFCILAYCVFLGRRLYADFVSR